MKAKNDKYREELAKVVAMAALWPATGDLPDAKKLVSIAAEELAVNGERMPHETRVVLQSLASMLWFLSPGADVVERPLH